MMNVQNYGQQRLKQDILSTDKRYSSPEFDKITKINPRLRRKPFFVALQFVILLVFVIGYVHKIKRNILVSTF